MPDPKETSQDHGPSVRAGKQRSLGGSTDPLGSWITAGAIGVVFLYFLWEVRSLNTDLSRWPFLLCAAGLFLLALYGIQQAILARSRTTQDEEVDASHPDGAVHTPAPTADGEESPAEDADTLAYGNPEDYTRRGNIRTIGAITAFSVYTLAAYAVGFLLASMIFVPVYMLASGERHAGKLVGLSLGTGVVAYLLFGALLNAPLTRGEWYSPNWLVNWIPL